MVAIQVPDDIVALLSDIWHHLGLDNEQRKQAIDDLRASLSDYVLKFVEQEQHRVDDTKQRIEDTRQRIHQISGALGEAEPSPIDNQAALLQQLALLQAQETVILQRKSAVVDIITKQLIELQAIYRLLDMEVPEEFAEVGNLDLSQSRLSYIEAALSQASQERDSRQSKLTKLLSAANFITQQLEERPIVIQGLAPKDLIFAEKKLIELQNLFSEKSRQLNEIRISVEKRWKDLQKDDDYIMDFKNRLSGLIASDIYSLGRELDVLNKQYAAALPQLVKACRERIAALKAELRHEAADAFELTGSLEEAFHSLEKEEISLKSQLENMRPILQQISKWEKLCLELREGLEEVSAYANDPNRFHGRQAFKMLKKEEDLRRLESKTLPRMQEKLHAMITNFERENGGRPLLIDGKAFLVSLKEFSSNGKENYSRTPTASPSVARVPGSASQTPSLVRRPSLNSGVKKALTTPESLPRPRRLRISSVSERCQPLSMQDRLTKVLEQAESALKNSKSIESEEILASLSQAIEDVNAADDATKIKHADALSDLYHKRAVIYTHLGDYDASIRDSESAQLALSWGRNAT